MGASVVIGGTWYYQKIRVAISKGCAMPNIAVCSGRTASRLGRTRWKLARDGRLPLDGEFLSIVIHARRTLPTHRLLG